MSNDTPRDWEELKKLAEAAESPSPWHESEGSYVVDTFEQPIWNDDGICGRHDAAFIAAFNPATVLELIAEVERLRAEKRDGLPSKEEFYATAKEAAESAKHLHPGRFKTPYRGGE